MTYQRKGTKQHCVWVWSKSVN